MAERTRIGAGDDKGKLSPAVENLLRGELGNRATFAKLSADARDELMRGAIVLLLQIAKRVLKSAL